MDIDETEPRRKTASPDGCVLIRCARSLWLCKTFAPDYEQAYDNARTFDAAELPLADLVDLHGWLVELASMGHHCVIRGALVAGERARGIRKLKLADRKTGDLPTILDVPRSWLALDLDGLPFPEPAPDFRNLVACARAVRPLLPPAFQQAECIVQATSSHGIKPGARLRLWYWLDRPITCLQAKCWLRKSVADPSLFQPQQCHYTADPLFIQGMCDPLVNRLAVLPGKPLVAVPPPDELTPPTRTYQCSGAPVGLAGLHGIIRTVVHAVKGERHYVLFWAACRFGEQVQAGHLDEQDAIEILLAATEEYGLQPTEADAARRTIASGIEKGKENYLCEFPIEVVST